MNVRCSFLAASISLGEVPDCGTKTNALAQTGAFHAASRRRFTKAETLSPLTAGSGLLSSALRLTRSALHRFITDRLPAKQQVTLLIASDRLTSGVVMRMNVGRAVLHGVLHRHMPLQPLAQIPRLRDVDRNPTPILGLPGINEIAG